MNYRVFDAYLIYNTLKNSLNGLDNFFQFVDHFLVLLIERSHNFNLSLQISIRDVEKHLLKNITIKYQKYFSVSHTDLSLKLIN